MRLDMIIAIIVDGEFDKFVEMQADAESEKYDLEQMGCVVRLKTFDMWAEAEAWANELSS
tara:strand:- start:2871 stop:3050 length:180 start_codon:yes stop_codon:yes gene_type:complete